MREIKSELPNKETNVFLMLIAVDERGAHGGAAQTFSQSSQLIVGLLDAWDDRTNAPLLAIQFDEEVGKLYSRIQSGVQRISELYYGKKGYVTNPSTFDDCAKKEVMHEIRHVGELVGGLFTMRENAVGRWLREVLRPSRRSAIPRHLTIITNDFTIPWYWMRMHPVGPLLCEAVCLGMLQLADSSRNQPEFSYRQSQGAPETGCYSRGKTSRALLIGGSPDLPFVEKEMNEIEESLTVPFRRTRQGTLDFKVERTLSKGQIDSVEERLGESTIAEQFRLVHFSGHYSSDQFLVEGRPISPRNLAPFIQNALLVLDGCSSSSGLGAWVSDVRGITSRLINEGGAIGCLVTVLPVKQDPLLSRVFLKTFYQGLRAPFTSIGMALLEARCALKTHLEKLRSKNPAWAAYQLIGSPSVRLSDQVSMIDEA